MDSFLTFRRLVLFPILFTAALAMILLVPIVPSAHFTLCHGSDCVNVVQLDSIGYHYGGWGAYANTGGYYTIQSWLCSCPLVRPGVASAPCCVAPYGTLLEIVEGTLFAADIATLILVIRRSPAQTTV